MPSDSFQELSTAYMRAEVAIKDAERLCDKLSIPSLNEIRCAMYHVMRTSGDMRALEACDEMQKAVSHCRRAYFDAREMEMAALYDASGRVLAALSKYAEAVNKVFLSYTDHKAKAIAARKAISAAGSVKVKDNREEHYETFDSHCLALREFLCDYETYQDDIDNAIFWVKIKRTGIVLAMVFGFVSATAAVLKFFLLS